MIMFYSQAGYYFAWLYQQQQAKEEMQEQLVANLPDEALDAISLTDNLELIKWEEEGREFFFKGEMYDVVRSKTVRGKTILFCVNDKKEETLIKRLSGSIQSAHQNSDGKSNKAVFLKLVNDPAVVDFPEIVLLHIPFKRSFTNYEVDLSARAFSISSPPPKV